MNLRILALGVVAIAVAVVAFAGTHSDPGHVVAVDPGAMNLTVKSGGSAGACDDTKCSVFVGSDFTLAVEITKAPVGGYIGLRTEVDVDGLTYTPKSLDDEIVWPDGPAGFFRSVVGSVINHGATTADFPPGPISNIAGNIVELNMACPLAKGNHTVDLVPLDAGNSDGSSFRLSFSVDATVAPDSLDINCIDPALDTDGDGCSDGQELQANSQVSSGGGRDLNNFWDFYDTPDSALPAGSPDYQRDKMFDLFGDIFRVASRFGANDTGPGDFDRNSDPLSDPNTLVEPSNARENYHPAFDRGPPTGANGIITGPADGNIDLFNDIFGVATQFGHSCQ